MQFMINKSDIFSIIIMNNIGYTITRDILEYDIVIVRCHVSLVCNNSYMPLVDMVPSDPDTIMTAMVVSQRMTEGCGHTSTVFTNDQQLYCKNKNYILSHKHTTFGRFRHSTFM